MREHLSSLLDDYRRYSGDVAVVRLQGNRRRVTTYGELAALAGKFATLLKQRGIRQGDRVLIWAENSAEWIAAFHGCVLLGVLAVPLDAAGSADFAARVAADVNPRLAVGDLLLMNQLPVGIPRMSFENWPSALPVQQSGPIAGLSADTPLQILFTSGTTGDPKGIVLTHGNVLASFTPIEKASQPYLRYVRLIHPLRILHTLPLSHVFGQTMGLWIPSIYRAELHIENRLVAARLVETIRRERISVLAAVPRVHALLKTYLESALPGLAMRIEAESRSAAPAKSMADRFIRAARRWSRYRSVHRTLGFKFWALISGGGALPASVESFWNALGIVVVQGYGMTETTALITLNHPFHIAQGTIGKPLAGREVKLGPDGEVLVRGDAISHATWSGGTLHPRTSEWLATGDLAQTDATGELRFLGRKSEVIVTAAGLNLHPEDLEAAIEQEPGVAACAVVPYETANGPEPVAVLALRSQDSHAADVIEHANSHLAEFQRLRRWVVWPEPDLPRTSTGKVRRKVVSASLPSLQNANGNGHTKNGNGHSTNPDSNGNRHGSDGSSHAPSDWLLALIAQLSGEAPGPGGDERRLAEDLHLDSLGLVQLSAAVEERTGIATNDRIGSQVKTVGDLRRMLAEGSGLRAADERDEKPAFQFKAANGESAVLAESPAHADELRFQTAPVDGAEMPAAHERDEPVYPRWPWSAPVRWSRSLFVEALMRPLVVLLGNPAVHRSAPLASAQPMLIVANHVTAFDLPLLQYALPAHVRRHLAVAMSGEMLEDYRHFRNPQRATSPSGLYLPGPLIYMLLTTLFNVFPLPRLRNFQRSFYHAGEALDRGMNVLLFPEGTRSADGKLARFRPGIGLLVKQSSVPVLPMAIRGLGELKSAGHGWFRSGSVEVRIGKPLSFSSADSELSITGQLHDAVASLLDGHA